MHIVNRKDNGWVVFSQMKYQTFVKSLCEVMEPYGYAYYGILIKEYCDAWESPTYPTWILDFDKAMKVLDSGAIMHISVRFKKEDKLFRVMVDEGFCSAYIFDDNPEINGDEIFDEITKIYKRIKQNDI